MSKSETVILRFVGIEPFFHRSLHFQLFSPYDGCMVKQGGHGFTGRYVGSNLVDYIRHKDNHDFAMLNTSSVIRTPATSTVLVLWKL